MGKTLFGLLLMITGLAIGIFWAYPTWTEIGEINLKKVEADATLERIRSLEDKRDQILAKYNSIPQDEKDKLAEFFPRSPDSGVWLVNMGQIATANGILLKNVAMEEGRAAQIQLAAEINKTYETFPFKVSISGNYSAFNAFLETMEKSRRLIEIDKLTFDAGDGKKDFYEFTVDAHTFWKK